MSRCAFKLLRQRKDGTLGPLFINARQRIPVGQWLDAESHPTKGFAVRPGWHCTDLPEAPHLAMTGRVWCLVEIENWEFVFRPKAQGGVWYLAKRMKVRRVLPGLKHEFRGGARDGQ